MVGGDPEVRRAGGGSGVWGRRAGGRADGGRSGGLPAVAAGGDGDGNGGQAARRWAAANSAITVICLQLPAPAGSPAANWAAPGPGWLGVDWGALSFRLRTGEPGGSPRAASEVVPCPATALAPSVQPPRGEGQPRTPRSWARPRLLGASEGASGSGSHVENAPPPFNFFVQSSVFFVFIDFRGEGRGTREEYQ